ncbi:hypothetical protein F383_21836 [Gossypium arboreum]|uniref:Uncharacterized protein n=1 Tax=Gossypium arboreum TaxID=29729 RepID=A0A0B0NXM9_GOSAR|nr:hypothetical protein F383_21836 [Gossypium arboreum]
MCCKKGFSLDR